MEIVLFFLLLPSFTWIKRWSTPKSSHLHFSLNIHLNLLRSLIHLPIFVMFKGRNTNALVFCNQYEKCWEKISEKKKIQSEKMQMPKSNPYFYGGFEWKNQNNRFRWQNSYHKPGKSVFVFGKRYANAIRCHVHVEVEKFIVFKIFAGTRFELKLNFQ